MSSTRHSSTPAGDEREDSSASTQLEGSNKLGMTENRYQLAFEHAPIGIAVVNFDYSFRRVNAALCEALGYTVQELLQRKFIDITHADDLARDTKLAEKLFRGDLPSFRVEKRFLRKDGQVAWLDVTAVIIRGDGGNPLYGMLMLDNITDRKRAEEALRTSEERYRSFVVNSSEGIWRLDVEEPIDVNLPVDEQLSLFYKHGYLAECNDALARMHGYERANDIVGLRFGDSKFTSHPANTGSMRKLIASNYRILDLQTEKLDADGSIRYYSTNLIGIVLNGRLLRTWGVQRDQTEQKRISLQLEHSHQQLRQLSGRLLALREREKGNVARELHDTVGQSLTGIKIEMSLLSNRLKTAADLDLKDLEKRVNEIMHSLDETIACTRAISTELRPSVLDQLGLAAAIEWQCEEFSRRMEIACDCDVPIVELKIRPAVSTALFRILQEALVNVGQHAQATAVHVELSGDDSRVTLTVNDNGRGITDDEITAPSSLGLLGMRERIEFLEGTFSIEGKPGQGTTVRAGFP